MKVEGITQRQFEGVIDPFEYGDGCPQMMVFPPFDIPATTDLLLPHYDPYAPPYLSACFLLYGELLGRMTATSSDGGGAYDLRDDAIQKGVIHQHLALKGLHYPFE